MAAPLSMPQRRAIFSMERRRRRGRCKPQRLSSTPAVSAVLDLAVGRAVAVGGRAVLTVTRLAEDARLGGDVKPSVAQKSSGVNRSGRLGVDMCVCVGRESGEGGEGVWVGVDTVQYCRVDVGLGRWRSGRVSL